MKRICIIGCGNLGSALARGLLFKKVIPPSDLVLCSRSRESLQPLANELGVSSVITDVKEVPADVDCCFVCVKPVDVKEALESLSKAPKPSSRILASTAAGLSISTLELWHTRRSVKICRVMPNVACAVGVGAIGVYSKEELELGFLSSLGEVVYVKKESQLDAITALAGSAPAFVAEVLAALVDGGVLCGLHRGDATTLARAVLGGVYRLLEREELEITEIRNSITSPAGTTITGLQQLEQGGLRAALINALKASYERGREINEQLKVLD